jgi:2-keto-4-pentenoate hydratase/2-oxohepta-3-ene-1,7-dioic acid hydratase in catechol pathway
MSPWTKPWPALVAVMSLALVLPGGASAQSKVTKYVRYSIGDRTSYGILEGETIREIKGDVFTSPVATGKTVKLSDVRLRAPVEPTKVILVGKNYRARLGGEKPDDEPTLSSKVPTSIVGSGESIVFPPGATNVHYGCDLVIVIGKRAKHVSVADAPKYIFGVTAGNDVTEREWQRKDFRYFRSKASDTFGPIGPVVAQGLNYNDLKLQARVNGELRQTARTNELIYGVDTVVSYISRFVTLLPGDVIFTGTPRESQAIKPGDVVEIELEGVGVLRNNVVGATSSGQ